MFTLGNGYRNDNAWNMPDGYSERVLRLLPLFDLQVMTTSGNWIIVKPSKFGHPKYQKWFDILDNGGEVIVREINTDGLAPKVPYKDMYGTVNAATFVHRVSALIRGEKIDWSFTLSDDDEKALLK